MIDLPDLNNLPEDFDELAQLRRKLENQIDKLYLYIVDDGYEFSNLEEQEQEKFLENLHESKRRAKLIQLIIRGHLLYSE